jgi:hypothetical protein
LNGNVRIAKESCHGTPHDLMVEVGLQLFGWNTAVDNELFHGFEKRGLEVGEAVDELVPRALVDCEERIANATNSGARAIPDIKMPNVTVG